MSVEGFKMKTSKIPIHSKKARESGSVGRRAFLETCLTGGLWMASNQFIAQAASLEAASMDEEWQNQREEMMQAWMELLGDFPARKPRLREQVREESIRDGIIRYHVSFQSERNDRITAYLLAPEGANKKLNPAMVCIHGTTRGSGKDRTVGLAGAAPGDPPDTPEATRAYGLELARRGYVTLSIDLLCDGERVPAGYAPYDSQEFYKRHPQWSMVGKNLWDVMRSVDFLLTLHYVDPRRIGCIGHSLGGHTSLFAAAFDRRISAAVCNGGMLSWDKRSDHWARPPDFAERDSGHAARYVYLPRFRPYIEDKGKPIPAGFDQLMMLTAPRALLVMGTEEEFAHHEIVDQVTRASKAYRRLSAGERLMMFSYPGAHNFPPVARRLGYNWLDRWLEHSPADPCDRL